MRFLFKLVLVSLILLPLLVLGGLYLCIEDRPLIQRNVRLTPDEVQRAKQLLSEHDPRKLKDGEVKSISVSTRELSLASNYLVHLLGNGGSVITMKDGYLAAQATVQLPKNPIDGYINIDLALIQTADLPRIDHLRIGQLEIPEWLANMGLHRGFDSLYSKPGYQFTSEVIHDVAMSQDRLNITYQWKSEITDVVRGALISSQEQERLKAYHQQLTHLTSRMPAGSQVSLINLLQPLFTLAQERSKTSNAEEENRAALLVLSAYVNGRGIKRLVHEAENWTTPIRHTVTLKGRKDFSQHFMTSASLSMMGGQVLSDAIGLFKEVDDSRGGSGFSFADLCADKAGTAFGERATSNNHAGRFQKRVTDSTREGDFMPVTSDLPEHMPNAEFQNRFGGLNSSRYNRMVEKIDERITALRLYQ